MTNHIVIGDLPMIFLVCSLCLVLWFTALALLIRYLLVLVNFNVLVLDILVLLLLVIHGGLNRVDVESLVITLDTSSFLLLVATCS